MPVQGNSNLKNVVNTVCMFLQFGSMQIVLRNEPHDCHRRDGCISTHLIQLVN